MTDAAAVIAFRGVLATMLACPRCRAELSVADDCPSCGAKFGNDGGTPVLIADDNVRQVSFEFRAENSLVDEVELLKIFRFPPRVANPRTLPYHVSPEHAELMRGVPAGATVLEIGCGGGQSRAWFAALGHRYIGTDISKTRVFEWLRTHGGPDVVCDTHFLPFRDESFDIVYCAAVFEHLACPVLAAQEVLRVLKPGGKFLGNASFLEPWHDHSFFHLTPLGAVELLRAAGFRPIYVWPSRGYTGFQAILSTFGSGIFRAAGSLLAWLYDRQTLIRNALKRRMGKDLRAEILYRGDVAGAIDWIAEKP